MYRSVSDTGDCLCISIQSCWPASVTLLIISVYLSDNAGLYLRHCWLSLYIYPVMPACICDTVDCLCTSIQSCWPASVTLLIVSVYLPGHAGLHLWHCWLSLYIYPVMPTCICDSVDCLCISTWSCRSASVIMFIHWISNIICMIVIKPVTALHNQHCPTQTTTRGHSTHSKGSLLILCDVTVSFWTLI